jgi:hypothetical protein
MVIILNQLHSLSILTNIFPQAGLNIIRYSLRNKTRSYCVWTTSSCVWTTSSCVWTTSSCVWTTSSCVCGQPHLVCGQPQLSICDLVSATKPSDVFSVNSGTWVLHKRKLYSKREFRENLLSDSHTLINAYTYFPYLWMDLVKFTTVNLHTRSW